MSDHLDEIRQKLGIKGPRTAKAYVPTDSLSDKEKRYQEEMKRLAEGGADYSGNEGWRKIMRRRM